MKAHRLILIVGLLMSPCVALSEGNVVEWSVDRNITLSSGSSTLGIQSSGFGGSVSLAKYSGDYLTRVIIKVLQPGPAVAPAISASLSVDEGQTATFTSSPNNVLRENTQVTGSAELSTAIADIGGSLLDYNVTKNSARYASQSITYPDALSRSINLAQSPITIFDSADISGVTPEQLASVFAGPGFLDFDFLVESKLVWNQDTPSTITAQFSGTNSGQIIIEYVPEPGTVVLFGLGGLMLLPRRR